MSDANWEANQEFIQSLMNKKDYSTVRTTFNGYYRDTAMSEEVYKWIKALEKEIDALKVDLACAEMRMDDSARLMFLIENEYVVKAGIDSYWLAEPDGTCRIGSKCVTPIEAIDKYRKEHP